MYIYIYTYPFMFTCTARLISEMIEVNSMLVGAHAALEFIHCSVCRIFFRSTMESETNDGPCTIIWDKRSISKWLGGWLIRLIRICLSYVRPAKIVQVSLRMTLRYANVAIGNPLEIGVSIGKSPLNSVFSIAMFDHQRVRATTPQDLWIWSHRSADVCVMSPLSP